MPPLGVDVPFCEKFWICLGITHFQWQIKKSSVILEIFFPNFSDVEIVINVWPASVMWNYVEIFPYVTGGDNCGYCTMVVTV